MYQPYNELRSLAVKDSRLRDQMSMKSITESKKNVPLLPRKDWIISSLSNEISCIVQREGAVISRMFMKRGINRLFIKLHLLRIIHITTIPAELRASH